MSTSSPGSRGVTALVRSVGVRTFLLATVAAIAACSSDGGTGGSLPRPEAVAVQAPAAAPVARSERITFANDFGTAVAKAAPLAAGPQLFYDDFNADGAGSPPPGWATQYGTWSVCAPQGESHEYCATTADGVTRPTFGGQSGLTDYSVDAETVRNAAATAAGGLMVLGRVVDSSHFYGLELRSDIKGSGKPYWYLERYAPSGWTVLGGGPFTVHSIPYYRLRMNFSGSRISAYVAYDYGSTFQSLGSVNDSAYAGGGVGLRVWGNAQQRFDEVRVTLAGMPTPTPTPSMRPGGISGLHVSGNSIVNGSGQSVVLHGVDRSGTEYSCVHGNGIFDGPNDRTSVAAIAGWHANAVRVPLNEDCWLAINGVSSAYAGTTYRNAIAKYVSVLNAAGLVAILDLHWNNGGSSSATGQEPMVDSDHGPAFWTSVAQAFKGE